ncbi:MAG: LysM peptidoglycan-binding domain-containing protein [Thermodesulfobacteriota bacterium]
MNKSRFLAIFFLLASLTFAHSFLPPAKDGATLYVVKRGDTLWDISNNFFDSPFFWPRLWEINSYIDNPNVIYPGDTIILSDGESIVKYTPEIKTGGFKKVDPPPPVVYYSRGGSEGFINDHEWEHTGSVIISEPTTRLLYYEGDTVYINIGTDDQAKVGDKYTIFRSSKEVFHPYRNYRIGHKVAILGELEVIEILGNDKAAAKITNSLREITKGAKIRPKEAFVKEVVLRKGETETKGVVVATKDNIELSGKGDIVYLDLGKKDNVVPGNLLTVSTIPKEAFDPDSGKKIKLPGAKIGKVILISVQENSSTALICESERQIEIGDFVSLDLKIVDI